MLKLQDYLDAPDFDAAVTELGASMRQALELPKVFQLGLVVPDAEAADRDLAEQGIKTVLAMVATPSMCIVEGVENRSSTTLAFAYHHGYELELIQPGEGAVFYARDLDPAGSIVLQHLGFVVRDIDTWVARLCSGGQRLMVRGRIVTGPVEANYAYFDTRAEHGIIMELISVQVFGRYLESPQGLYTFLGRFKKRPY
jgi:hypothetical protein